ncbi:hypothetical protein L1887_10831 [Cichorium endivia]|nr:hypothetical protein L1887_10831 [Cichorium endivia]
MGRLQSGMTIQQPTLPPSWLTRGHRPHYLDCQNTVRDDQSCDVMSSSQWTDRPRSLTFANKIKPPFFQSSSRIYEMETRKRPGVIARTLLQLKVENVECVRGGLT